MAIYRLTPEGVSTGSTWETSIGIQDYIPNIQNVVAAGDAVLISKLEGEKVNFNIDSRMDLGTINSGTAENKLKFISGSRPTLNSVLRTRDSAPIFLGYADYPWYSGNNEGDLGFFVESIHTDFSGLTMYHFSSALYLQGNSGYIGAYDLKIFNSGTGVYIASTNGPVTVDTIRMSNIRKTGIRVYSGVSDVTIRDAKIDMSTIQGAPFPNGIFCDAADNVSISNTYIKNAGYSQVTTGTIRDNYIQGDGVTADAGTKLHIRDSHFLRCADRGVDSKSNNTRIVDCTIDKCKLGVGIWASSPDNKLIGVTLKNITATRDEGAYIQSQGYIKVIGCNIIADAQSDDENGVDYASIFRTNIGYQGALNTRIDVIGGKVDLKDEEVVPLLRFFKTGDRITLTNVMINGVIYNKDVVYDSNNMSNLIYLSDLINY